MELNDLINEHLIMLDLNAESKQEVFAEMANALHTQGRINDKIQFVKDVKAREALGNTGFEGGVALPHAKSSTVMMPSVAIGVSKVGIDYGAEDGLPSTLFFMIASPENTSSQHIDILAELSSKLIDGGFIEKFKQCVNAQQALQLMLQKPQPEENATAANKGFIIGVTGCPTGVAHTYLAAEALEKGAASLGYKIKVETNGSIGVKNSPTAEEIASAECIIVASDKQVEMTRFAGKKLIEVGVKEPIKDAAGVINKGLNAPIYDAGKETPSVTQSTAADTRSNLYRYLMNGVSHMIPFVVTGGLLIALALAIGGEPSEAGMAIPAGSLWNKVLDVGVVAFTLMIPILAGYIAYAIADRPGLAPGLIGGWIANNGSFYDADAGTGFIGAIVAGLLVGYFVKWLVNINWHKFLQPLVPIMIAPILGSLFIACMFIFVLGAPIANLMDGLNELLTNLSTGNVVLLGIVLGGMAGFDMGGPFNKVAFLFSVGMIASGQTQFMGAMACAIPVAPLGMGLATLIGRQLFEDSELEAGKAAGAMGLVGISEGAIPFAAQDPLSVIPANMIGSMVAAVMAFSFGITNSVAHGGPIVALLGAMNEPLLALLCMASGAVATAIVCIALKKMRQPKLATSLA